MAAMPGAADADRPPQALPGMPAMPLGRWMDLMRVDKKVEAGEIRFVLINGLGHAVVRPAPDARVAEVIAAHSAPA